MVQENIFKTNTLWSQIDSNFHLRHSAYADIAATARMSLLIAGGITFEGLQKAHLGPILFREELFYKKEILGPQELTVKSYLKKIERNYSKWSMTSEIYRNDGELSCVVEVDGAWIDLKLRKIASLPDELKKGIEQMPKTKDFVILD